MLRRRRPEAGPKILDNVTSLIVIEFNSKIILSKL